MCFVLCHIFPLRLTMESFEIVVTKSKEKVCSEIYLVYIHYFCIILNFIVIFTDNQHWLRCTTMLHSIPLSYPHHPLFLSLRPTVEVMLTNRFC